MTTLTVTDEGKIEPQYAIVQHLGVRPGDQVEVDTLPDGKIHVQAARKKHPISEVFGMLRSDNGPHLSIEEINEVIRKGWAGEL